MAGNSNLASAMEAKQDEFYTQLRTIEDELRHYRKHFKGKTVLCNCDDPFESNFFKYFALNFNKLGLKKLIATCYAGVMGVPITFLDKFNPDQFEIIGITKTWFGLANKVYPKQIQVNRQGKRSQVTKLNDGAVIKVAVPPEGKTYYIVEDDFYIQTYPRLLIKNKNPEVAEK